MRSAAFFRNVNLGRPNAPTRVQLETAFLEAGATSATSFLVNGTLVFDAAAGARPRAIAARACGRMRASCGLREPVFVRAVAELAALVSADPFGGAEPAGDDFRCISFLAGHRAGLPDFPFETPRADVAFVGTTGAEVFSIARVVGKSTGSPNAWLERTLGAPATTRNWRTVVRLVDKFA
jgi:uncharacterized protein (DUF1697 family)